ncbi:MAG: 16S rRNA (guanine(527)-N(7))-methyltransferase RsmG [Actinobacteria bacterium]|nr:MAG: 16S rRNA (guanine(527)-N(7))-methyltransferase RsmG [Actinomycetota bacterium]
MEHPPADSLPDWLQPAYPGLVAFAEILATAGVEQGLIGPRELPRIWSRHLLNCAVVADPAEGLIPTGALVADVGSGAGLPGLVWALARTDLKLVLIEPLLRRANFLTTVVSELGIGEQVKVTRVRAEDLAKQGGWAGVDLVTARAVAPLLKLLSWTVPLLRTGGSLVAFKGSSVATEFSEAAAVAASLGIRDLRIGVCGQGVVEPLTTVVLATRGAAQ